VPRAVVRACETRVRRAASAIHRPSDPQAARRPVERSRRSACARLQRVLSAAPRARLTTARDP
jgi:hypothetical protein